MDMLKVFREAMNEPFDLPQMLERIEYHHARGNLTDAAREEAVAYAREKANPYGGVNVLAKLEEIENRLRALEEGKHESGAGETVEEFNPNKWYYNGDKCAVDGKVYNCIAPEGVVCVWSPVDYPAYWEAVNNG